MRLTIMQSDSAEPLSNMAMKIVAMEQVPIQPGELPKYAP